MAEKIEEMKKYFGDNEKLKVLQNSILKDQGSLAESNREFYVAKNIYTQVLEYGIDHRILIGLGYINLQLRLFKEGCPQVREAIKQRPYLRRYSVNYLICEKKGL